MNGKRILLVKLSAVGDVVHCLAVLEALKRAWPESRIDWLVEEAASGLVVGHPFLRRVWISPRKALIPDMKRGKIHSLVAMARLARCIRREPYDLVLDLQGLYKSAVWTWWAQAPRKIGWSETREWTRFSLTETIGPENFGLHAVDRYLDFVRYLGIDPGPPRFRIPWSEEDGMWVERWMGRHGLKEGTYLALNPVAQWESKLWEAEHFSRLADMVVGRLSLPVVFTGGPADRRYVARVRAGMKHPSLDLCGTTSLAQLAVLYRKSALVVSTDTGPMHVAAAVNRPVVALFGPTDPARTGPYGSMHRVVRAGEACSPCFKRTCGHKRCMRRIAPEDVFRAVEATIQGRNSPRV